MNIYIDEIIIENLIVNISIIYLLYLFTKSKLNIFKIFATSLFLSIISVVKLLDICNNVLIQILSINIITYFLFKPNNILSYIKHIIYFFVIYIEYIGITIFITLLLSLNIDLLYKRICLYIVVFVITYIINKYMWKLWISLIKNNDLKYKLITKEGIVFNLMLDTGNYVTDPLGIYEVFMISKKKYIEEIKKKNKFKTFELIEKSLSVVEIQISTAIGKDKLKGYIFDDIKIYKSEKELLKLKKAIIIFLDNDFDEKTEGIIGYYTYINKLGGVGL